MVQREGILEVKDRKHQAHELTQRDYKRDSQRGALRRQDVHAADADVLRDEVTSKVRPKLWNLEVEIKQHQRSCKRKTVKRIL